MDVSLPASFQFLLWRIRLYTAIRWHGQVLEWQSRLARKGPSETGFGHLELIKLNSITVYGLGRASKENIALFLITGIRNYENIPLMSAPLAGNLSYSEPL